jgi:hypothetical protein
MKRIFIGLILIALLSAPATALKYYGYGDSISYYDYMYLIQMRDRYDPAATVSHNSDGPGMSSAWGLANIGAHYTEGTEYFVILFGNNDKRWNIPATDTGKNLQGMYNYAIAHGAKPIVLIHTLEDPVVYGDESVNLSIIESYLTDQKISFIKMYDAIDFFPNNLVMDGFNKSLSLDGVHPTPEGQSMMADYLWSHYTFPKSVQSGDTVGIFRGGYWTIHNPDATFIYGQKGDIPLLGDWNGDHVKTPGVYRSGIFYLRNENSNGNADIVFSYGNPTGDTPLIGDWNGDGIDTVGINRNGILYLRNTNNNGIADTIFGQSGGEVIL